MPRSARQVFRVGVAALAVASACTDSTTPSVEIHVDGRIVPVAVEIADDPEERARGLMYRTDLEPDDGMLFLFPDERERSFWMKNTPTSLDILYLSSAGAIVGIAERTVPFSLAPIPSGAAAERVLEVPAGFVDRHGVEVGDRVTYRGVPRAPSG